MTNREADGKSLRYQGHTTPTPTLTLTLTPTPTLTLTLTRYQGHTMRSSWWELNPGYERVAVSLIDTNPDLHPNPNPNRNPNPNPNLSLKPELHPQR